MRRTLILAVLTPALLAFAPPPVQSPLDAASLKAMLEGLGHNPKPINSEPGKEKFEVVMKTTELTVPVGVEISPSGNIIWLTVNVGAAPAGDKATAARFADLLRSNAKTQPSFFYITTNNLLMFAVPVENRAVAPAVLKRWMDKLAEDTQKTRSLWED
jgi:hypothetical protein